MKNCNSNHPNKRNAKTGIRSTSPTPVKSQGRVAKKKSY